VKTKTSRSICLYCENPADELEHAIPEAIGGRLQAPVLCGAHNRLIGERVDRPLCEWFAPLTHAIGVARQRGTTGTSFRAQTADGTATTRVGPGYVVELPFSIQKNQSGRPVRATGELSAVQHVANSVGTRAGEKWQLLEVVVAPPKVTLPLGLLDQAHPGLVKIALHFVAITLPTVLAPQVVTRYASVLLDGAPAYDWLTFTMLRSPYFTEDDRPCHEVALFDGDGHATVAISLYGVFRLLVRLDGVKATHTIRYLQYLDGAPPRVSCSDAVRLSWVRLSEADVDAFKAEFQERVSEVFRRQAERYVNDCINEVLLTALANYFKRPSSDGLAPHLDAELVTKILDTSMRHEAVRQVCARVQIPPPPKRCAS